MARTLLILRHGKSLRGPEYADDFQRPLARRGEKAALRMGRLLSDLKVVPELVITSPAARALSTAKLVRDKLGEIDIVEEDDIYDADMDDLLGVVLTLPSEFHRVLLVGHNPGLEYLVDELVNSGETVLKTCSLAVVRLECGEWQNVAPGSGKLLGIYHPREMAD